jgi:small subunit ribosomal protein S6e
MKIVISQKDKSYQTELPKEKEPLLYGTRVGSSIDGSLIGAAGYTFAVRGGSDKEGFPMRADLSGAGRRRIMLKDRPGIRKAKDGLIVRRLIRGNTVSDSIAQLNVIVTAAGPTPLEQLFPKAAKEKKE